MIQKILNGYKLPEILEKYLGKKETGLFLNLAAYSLISENNAAQYYSSYAYSHPLFTKQMHIYILIQKYQIFLRDLQMIRG